MKRHNLRTVVTFEVRRTLNKRRFWIATLIVPVVMIAVFGLIQASSQSTQNSLAAQKKVTFSFAYSDASGYVNGPLITKLGGVRVASESKGIALVRSGRLDAYFEFPKNLLSQTVHVFAKDVGIFNNGRYSTIATDILQSSADAAIHSPTLARLARGAVTTSVITYSDGVPSPGIGGMIPPLIFLVIFYVIILLLGNQMLSSTLEEKENRVTEMILTTVDSTTLILGKVLSLFTIGLVQILIFLAPLGVGYAFMRTSLNLPNLHLSSLVFDPVRLSIGALLLLAGFSLFSVTLVAIGAIVPTAKEAGSFFGGMMALIFVPFYAVSLILSHPNSLISNVFTYFPYSAPVTGMLRNAFGSLSVASSLALVVELLIFAAIMLRIAVQLFRYGSIEYSRKVQIRAALGISKSPR
ncbi:MAG: ABC transporter permease [Acidimicrobiales bacterium]